MLIRVIALGILVSSLYALAACGQKGPLTLPPDKESRAVTVLAP